MRIHIAVLNLRMGGQLSSMTSLVQLLAAAGIDAQIALPSGVPSTGKRDVTAFCERPLRQRVRQTWHMLRTLPLDPARDVVHLVVPTPAFAPIAKLLPVPSDRVLVQYEGPPTHFDGPHLRALRDDPLLFGPRIVLNNALWAHAARPLQVHHLATYPALAQWLRANGFGRVHEVANVTVFAPEDGEAGQHPPWPDAATTINVAYIGHCHPVKGVPDLIAAFALAAPQRPDLHMRLALSADGDLASIDRQIPALPDEVRGRVHRHGLVPVAAWLQHADVLALPYRSLASTTLYPSLLLEADAAGCPLLIADLPDLRAVLPDSNLRVQWVAPRDVAALAQALIQLPKRPPTVDAVPLLKLPPAADRVRELARIYAAMAGHQEQQ